MGTKYQKKSWVDFSKKMNYILNNLCDGDKNKFVSYFTETSLLENRKNRKKAIENWLNGNTKKPNKFFLDKFKISEFQFNDEQLFSHNAFEHWSFETFQKRVDDYLLEKTSSNIQNEMKFIYFFNILEKKISFFEIIYPNSENHFEIELTSPIYTKDMTYKGTVSTYNNMTYITVKNKFDQMFYIFKNSVNIYKQDLKVLGTAQCVDAKRRKPKIYTALLSSKKLSEIEEREFSHKLNHSNLIIVDDFNNCCRTEKDYFLENYIEKIHDLEKDIAYYEKNQKFSKDIYFDIIMKEYKSYINIMDKAFNHNDYPINSQRESILFALEDMCKENKANITIIYLLDSENITLLDGKNSIMEMQLKLLKQGRLNLSYTFIIPDYSLLTATIIEALEYLKKSGVKINFIKNHKHATYSKILLIEGKNFAIYKRKDNREDNRVTKNADSIEHLRFIAEELSSKALPLEEFIKENCKLHGEWYAYSYHSLGNNRSYTEAKLTIKHNKVQIDFDESKSVEGDICKYKDYTLLLFEYSTIRIYNINIEDEHFKISIIGRERNMHFRDVLLFGIMSRKKLKTKNILMLLDALYQKDDEAFRVKVSNNFESTLANFGEE